MDCGLPEFFIHGILQAWITEWVSMPSSRDIPKPGNKPRSLVSPALIGRFFTTSATREAWSNRINIIKLIYWSLMFEREFPLVEMQLNYLHRWLSDKKSSRQWRRHWVWSVGQEDPLEQEMATHSSILAWKIPQTEEPGRLQSMGSQRVGHDWVTEHACIAEYSTGHVTDSFMSKISWASW